MPTLYVVATPIGNLEDITVRALRVLAEVELIAAEDTRVTRKLLSRWNIDTPLTSYNAHTGKSKLPSLLSALATKDVALTSDAGTPGISDPGRELVEAAASEGFAVVPIPGASAVTTALGVSGFLADQFVYLGFLPRRRADRRKLLESIARERKTLVAFETPHRIGAALQDILDALGDRKISVCRELTKVYEEVWRGVVSQAQTHFDDPRGEFTLVIQGSTASAPDASREDASRALRQLKLQGVGAKHAVAQVVEQTGLPKKEVYRLWLDQVSHVS